MKLYRFTLENGKPEHYTHSLQSAEVRVRDGAQHQELRNLAPGQSMTLWEGDQSVERLM